MRRNVSTGVFGGGLPYVRFGRGQRPVVVFAGLGAENKVSPRMARMMYRFLGGAYTVNLVTRRPGLPQGFTLADMADDYATMIREEFGRPVDLIGVSTGGSIALHFAADHPELVRRLVLHSSAHTLNDHAKRLQLEFARLGGLGQWRAAFALLARTMLPRSGRLKTLGRPLTEVAGWLMSRRPPKDASDLVVTVQAEDALAFRDRLPEIRVPTLVAGGTEDPFYSAALFRETAEGIPGARLALYEGMGHAAHGKQFHRDVLAFLAGLPGWLFSVSDRWRSVHLSYNPSGGWWRPRRGPVYGEHVLAVRGPAPAASGPLRPPAHRAGAPRGAHAAHR